jgi:hypothetical protein
VVPVRGQGDCGPTGRQEAPADPRSPGDHRDLALAISRCEDPRATRSDAHRLSPHAVREVHDHGPDPVPGKSAGSALPREGAGVEDVFQGKRIRIRYDREAAVFSWEAPDDVELAEAYWFAWKAFHPETEIWGEAKYGGEEKPQE